MSTNAVRQSSRTVAPSFKVRDRVSDDQETSFLAAGQRKARELEEFGGKESRDSRGGSGNPPPPPAGGLEEDGVQVRSTPRGNVQAKPPRKGKWTLPCMIRVAEKGLKFQCL
ncbi:unnamed protein product [Ectocarpus sp. CCAP 1310/34]|nr:unnamed protein product [Ectocarpus sp. CCAP 1310/34]